MRNASLFGIILIAGLLAVAAGQNADWTQWRGPGRDGTATSFVEPKNWPDALTLRWKIDIGAGYATPLVAGDRVYSFSRQNEDEVLQAIDAASGKAIWRSAYPAPFKMNPSTARHGAGPKSTPAMAGGRIFTMGMNGMVTAFDAATGKQLWQKPEPPVQQKFHTAQSPIVDRGMMIIHVGGQDDGALTALDPVTGDVKWSWKGDGPGYASPIIVEIEGTRHVITFSQKNLVGVDEMNGELLWSVPFEARSTTNAITPLVYAGRTIIFSGQGKPLTAYTLSKRDGKWSADLAWENPQLSLSFSNPILFGDAVFSMSAVNSGQFFWVDAKSGKTLWTSEPRQGGNAAIVRAGNLLLVLKDDAQLMVARADASGFTPLKTYTVADSATWAAPAISGSRIFVRGVETLALWTLQ
jgi:outer membrane protein assembly factor BamB